MHPRRRQTASTWLCRVPDAIAFSRRAFGAWTVSENEKKTFFCCFKLTACAGGARHCAFGASSKEAGAGAGDEH